MKSPRSMALLLLTFAFIGCDGQPASKRVPIAPESQGAADAPADPSPAVRTAPKAIATH